MKKQRTVLMAAVVVVSLVGTMANTAWAAEKKSKKAKAQPAEQQAASQSNEDKIAQIQKSIDELKVEIDKIKTERTDLQAKLEQSDKDVAAQMQRIDDIKKKQAEKEQAAGALDAQKKP